MSKEIVAQNRTVMIGVDVHTRSHVVAVKVGREIVDRCTLSPAPKAWQTYMKKFPGCEVHVIYESGPQGYNLHDWLEQMKGQEGQAIFVYIAPPAMIPQAPGKKRVKTDRRDSLRLIQAFESGSFRPVVVPDKATRAERELVRTRDQAKKDARRLKCRIHGFVKFHGVMYPPFTQWTDEWERELLSNAKAVDPTGDLHFTLKAKFRMLRDTEKVVASIEKRIDRLYRSGACSKLAQRIMEHKGIGKTTAVVIATEVADFKAFDNSDAFASYTGLVSGARGTGDTMHQGPITKEGNRRLRWVFVECAWVWVRCDPAAALKFERLKAKRGTRKAIVAMARRLAVRVYHHVVSEAQAA